MKTTDIISIIVFLSYVVVFVIQQIQINRQNKIISSMKSFMDIFSVDEVKKYIELREESYKLAMDAEITNNDKLNTTIKDVMYNYEKEYKESLDKDIIDRFSEFSMFALSIYYNQNPELRDSFLNEALPLNKDYIMSIINEVENNNT